jgi:hypothetical protein
MIFGGAVSIFEGLTSAEGVGRKHSGTAYRAQTFKDQNRVCSEGSFIGDALSEKDRDRISRKAQTNDKSQMTND